MPIDVLQVFPTTGRPCRCTLFAITRMLCHVLYSQSPQDMDPQMLGRDGERMIRDASKGIDQRGGQWLRYQTDVFVSPSALKRYYS